MRILLYLALGFTVGSISGTLGIGGGVLLMPALIWICQYDQLKAAGTTLAVLAMPIGLLAAWKYYQQSLMDLEAAVWIAVAFAAGAYGGASVVTYIPQSVLRLGFGLLMMYIAVRFIVASNSEVANAAAGLTAVALAWLSYLGLRRLGRHHLPRPDLGEHIRSKHEQRWGDPEYQI
jgi:hypothetical protein